jgi:signal-transduction protein with cAMP-binding, CBS, and nucleotidyltransferase domain
MAGIGVSTSIGRACARPSARNPARMRKNAPTPTPSGAFVARRHDLLQASYLPSVYSEVHEVMTKKPVTVFGGDTVQTALEKMKTWRVRRLPVVDTLGHLQGILSIEDIVLQGLERGGVDTPAIIAALRTMYERRPIEVGTDMVRSR